MISRTEWTIEVGEDEDFEKSYVLVLMFQGNYEMTKQRLDDLSESMARIAEASGEPPKQFYRLVKREVTLSEWEPA